MPSEEPYCYIECPEAESIMDYCKGGYHPVKIDDIFHSRYRVANKLGHGAYATVWLVKDLSSGRYASLKILAAETSKGASEVEVLRHLRKHQSAGALGEEYVMKAFDEFEIKGPNGTHQAVVTELLGPSLGYALERLYDDDRFPMDIGKKICAQVSLGVAYLHQCGVVHGDLHLGNVLLYSPGMEHWSLEELQRYFRKPSKWPVTRHDGGPVIITPHVPKYVVASPNGLEVLKLCLGSTEAVHVKICDFGEAFLWKGKPELIELHTPRVYAAPEVLFKEAISPATDIWALAVFMHMVLSGMMPLFSSYYGIEKELVREMVLILGKLPSRWWTKWEHRAEYFDDHGRFVGEKKKLSGKFVKVPPDMGEEDLGRFEKMVRKMVCYEMEDRISADGVVRQIPPTWLRNSLHVITNL